MGVRVFDWQSILYVDQGPDSDQASRLAERVNWVDKLAFELEGSFV